MKHFLNVNSIESFSTKDGDGTRCVVFLQGCPYRCIYCHNIETQNMQGGTQMDVDELVIKALKYKPYYGDKGGVTISGGEPLVQAKELILFLNELKKNNINIALDTSGARLDEHVKNVITLCDHIILDLKFATEQEYKEHCGGSLFAVLKFLEECQKQNKRIWIRTVVVPGYNDTKEAIKKYAEIIKNYKIEKVELLPFHTLGFSKYQKLGAENILENTPPLCEQVCRDLQQFLDFELSSC